MKTNEDHKVDEIMAAFNFEAAVLAMHIFGCEWERKTPTIPETKSALERTVRYVLRSGDPNSRQILGGFQVRKIDGIDIEITYSVTRLEVELDDVAGK